jgi:hypothetical protein
MAIRPDTDQYLRPYVFASSDRVSEFFPLSLQQPLSDIVTRLEAYCLSGIEGQYLLFNESGDLLLT